MWHMYDGYHFWGMHLFWWIIWILLLGWLFFGSSRSAGWRSKEDTPLEILQKRFASGTISHEEYEERKAILERDRQK